MDDHSGNGPGPTLAELRVEIDRVDAAIVELLAQRLEACRVVAHVKQGTAMDVIQPARVREVLDSRRQHAIDAGVDPDFAEQIFRTLLAESHRIELAAELTDPPPPKAAVLDTQRSALETVACRVDHVVVAVADIEAAGRFFSQLGFRTVPTPDPAIVAHEAGGVTIVAVGPSEDPSVADYLARHGSGVQHIAIEVLNAGFARRALEDAGIALVTDIVVDADGHEQFFAATDPASGVQLGFISRTGHRVGMTGANVRTLFTALRD